MASLQMLGYHPAELLKQHHASLPKPEHGSSSSYKDMWSLGVPGPEGLSKVLALGSGGLPCLKAGLCDSSWAVPDWFMAQCQVPALYTSVDMESTKGSPSRRNLS